MADSTIGNLPAASVFDDSSLLVVEQAGSAMKLAGLLLKQYCQNAVVPQFDQVVAVSETAIATADEAKTTADSVRADANAGKFNGAAGKSAYSSAQDGGFTGTEEQFNKGLSVMGGVSGIDTTVTQNSGNLITSGAVYSYIQSLDANEVKY